MKQYQSKVKRFFTGNGFYLSLAACVIAVGGVALATFAGDFSELFSSESKPQQSQTQPVDHNVTDVPKTTTTTTTTTTKKTTTTTTTTPDDLFVLPLSNLVSKEFSDGQPIYSETMKDFRLHDGTDFRGKHGDKVMSVANGTVSSVTKDALWGNSVVIDHGYGVQSVYHGVTATVKQGETVKAGQAIGTLSSIPCEAADGEHLHLEIIADDEVIDPIDAIGREVRYESDETDK